MNTEKLHYISHKLKENNMAKLVLLTGLIGSGKSTLVTINK